MKLTIFNVCRYVTCRSWAYSQIFLHSLVTTIVKTYGWENVRSGKCRREYVQSEKSPSWKCPIGEVSVEELSFAEVLVWDLSMGKCKLGNFPDTNLLVELSQGNCFKEL